MVNIQQKHSNPAILRHDASFVIFFVWKGYHDVFSLFSFFFFLRGICYNDASHFKKNMK